MKRYYVELAVGVFVFITLVCVGYLAVKLGKMQLMGNNHKTLHARFQSVGGLRVGSAVEMAGVEIGRVEAIILDEKQFVARVTMKIKKSVIISDDAIASVKTSGLIGDKYIRISPGGSDVILKEGDTLVETESPLDFEELVAKYVFGNVKTEPQKP